MKGSRWGRLRSVEVGRGRLKVAGVFGALFGRPGRRWWYEHFLTMIAAKIMNNYEKIPNMTKNDKNIDIFDNDCSENHEKIWKSTKMTKHNKNIDMFDHDCSENHEQLWKNKSTTKTLTFLNMIAAKIVKSWSSWWIWRLRLCQNRDLFMPDLPK